MTELALLHTAAGDGAVTTDPALLAEHALGGLPPLAVVSPATPAAAAATVRWAAAHGCRVVPLGAGTRLRRWQAPAGPWLALSTRRLNAALDLNAENLSACFGAGLDLAAVAAALVPHDLYCPPLAHLPVGETPHPPAAAGAPATAAPPGDSLGGAVAARLSGPQRARHGPLRGWVLALQVVTPTGELVQLGAPTVKNVAGYDLVKLHVGARGSLGLITAVTLRLSKLPPEQVCLAAAFADPAAAIAALQALAATANAPVAAELLDAGSAAALRAAGAAVPVAVPAGGALALVELAGNQIAAWEAAVAAHLRAAGAALDREQPAVWEAYARLPLHLAPDCPVRLRAAVPPAAAPTLWAAAAAAGAHLLLGPISGTAQLCLAATADLAPRLQALRAALAAAGGYVELEAGPPAAAAALPPAPPSPLEQALRRSLDPLGTMHG